MRNSSLFSGAGSAILNLVIAGLDPVIQTVSSLATTALDYPVEPGNDGVFYSR